MKNLSINVSLNADEVSVFDGKDLMITPVSDDEAALVGQTLLSLYEALEIAANSSAELSHARSDLATVLTIFDRSKRLSQSPIGENLQ